MSGVFQHKWCWDKDDLCACVCFWVLGQCCGRSAALLGRGKQRTWFGWGGGWCVTSWVINLKRAVESWQDGMRCAIMRIFSVGVFSASAPRTEPETEHTEEVKSASQRRFLLFKHLLLCKKRAGGGDPVFFAKPQNRCRLMSQQDDEAWINVSHSRHRERKLNQTKHGRVAGRGVVCGDVM